MTWFIPTAGRRAICCSVNHKGTPFDTGRYVRRMHRTTVAADAAAYRATLLPPP